MNKNKRNIIAIGQKETEHKIINKFASTPKIHYILKVQTLHFLRLYIPKPNVNVQMLHFFCKKSPTQTLLY